MNERKETSINTYRKILKAKVANEEKYSDVTIIEILITQQDLDIHGEFERKLSSAEEKAQYKKTVITRIGALVELLGKIASQHLSAAKTNQIVRIILNEFALFLAVDAGPFKHKKFVALLDQIRKFAEQFSKEIYPLPAQNIHLSLGTIPLEIEVLDDDTNQKQKRTVNVSLYVILGTNPIIHVTAKSTVSNGDLDYPQAPAYGFFSRYSRAGQFGGITAPSTELVKMGLKLPLIQLSAIIKCITAGGISFFVVPEICLDHRYKIAANSLKQLIQLQSADTDVKSCGITHVLISHSIRVRNESVIGETITHADPQHSELKVKKNEAEDGLDELEEFDPLVDSQLDTLPFGVGSFKIKIYPPYRLTTSEEIASIVAVRNQILVMMLPLARFREQHPERAEVITITMVDQFLKLLQGVLVDLSKRYQVNLENISRLLDLPTRASKKDKIVAMLVVANKLRNIITGDETKTAFFSGVGDVVVRNIETYLPVKQPLSEKEAQDSKSSVASVCVSDDSAKEPECQDVKASENPAIS